MIRLLASWSQGVRGISATRCQDRGLSRSECILDGPSEREAQILPAEGTPEVIQVQGPHHGTGQLPASQVLDLAGETQGEQGWVPWSRCAGGTGSYQRRGQQVPSPGMPVTKPALRAGLPLPLHPGALPGEPTLLLMLSLSSYPTHWLPLVA